MKEDVRDEIIALEKERHGHTTTKIIDDESKATMLGEAQQGDDRIELAAQIKHFSHQHFLFLRDEVQKDDRITCDGCIEPITDAFYSCTKQEEDDCHFFLHKTCAQLPTERLHPFHPHLLKLLPKAPSTDGMFECHACSSFSHGFLYSCERCQFYLDLQCNTLSNSLTHPAHRHPLTFNTKDDKGQSYISSTRGILRRSNPSCRGCGDYSQPAVRFSCVNCNFHLCIQCIQLPLTASHRYDNHPLKLTHRRVKDELGECYCQICEGERDSTHWFYYCKDCDFDCHPHCVVGRYRHVKLGSTYKHSHQHLVTLVEKKKSVIPFDKRDNILPCEACGKPCEGLVFECSQCNINIHRIGYC
ncbi:hypothetical protein L3X38_038333 [Prunus dulcis]|uniref:DC1 domain-containing protein n=1 Tax=Prunus dulcis TaxID=3755 RepID=A0AAD4YRF7_PRUDU|nr:hypothetical protein L3X38_038333 [Prunus dulcis]